VAKNVIELNGKRYDAVTGTFLGAEQAEASAVSGPDASEAAKPAKGASSAAAKGRHIDGFFRPGTASSHVAAKATPSPAAAAAASKKIAPAASAKHSRTTKPIAADIARPATTAHRPAKKSAVSPATATAKAIPHAHSPATRASKQTSAPAARHQAKPAQAHTPTHSQTLMRRYVHKPEVTIKPAIKPQAPAEIAAAPVSSLVHKRSVTQVDPQRLERAKHVVKHNGVQRFNHAPAGLSPVSEAFHIPVVAHEVPHIAVHEAPVEPITPSPSHHHDIFEAAIARADSHTQKPHPIRRGRQHRRLINAMAIATLAVVIIGFVTYLNIPNIQLHVASLQAGFKVDMPAYKPTGYALQGGVQRDGNTVSLRFTSGENNYTITQQPSTWNSQTLAENTLALAGDDHVTINADGRTVFIYHGSNAVWVNGGVRYDINTNAPLSADDISKLASSL
jgi:hypothetical protein